MLQRLEKELASLTAAGNFRRLPDVDLSGGQWVNLSSNDYLGLAADLDLQREFLETLPEGAALSSASSRLLTGNSSACRQLEALLALLYGSEAALFFNSGYDVNTGILPAVSDNRTLILSDKLVHASLIDGIRLSPGKHLRFRHNDLEHLERLLAEHAGDYETVIAVTESVFSMDGDRVDLNRLTALKKRYPNLMLYLDEAHGVGVFGPGGLGCAEEAGCCAEIDFLVGTCGKALASQGAYVICRQVIRDYLVNKVRPFIFTTALPPLNLLWTANVLQKLKFFENRRVRLADYSRRVTDAVRATGRACASQSQIVPFLVGESADAVACAAQFQRNGFYVLPIRPPTVPEGAVRLRFSLTAGNAESDIDRLIKQLKRCL